MSKTWGLVNNMVICLETGEFWYVEVQNKSVNLILQKEEKSTWYAIGEGVNPDRVLSDLAKTLNAKTLG